jgi:hypothetical protein
VVEVVDVEAVLGRDTIVGLAGIATFPLELLDMVGGRALIDEEEEVVDEEGRAAMLELIVVLYGRGSATDMTG